MNRRGLLAKAALLIERTGTGGQMCCRGEPAAIRQCVCTHLSGRRSLAWPRGATSLAQSSVNCGSMLYRLT